MKTLTELFDENGSWHTPGRSPIAGDHEGREAAFTQFGRYGGETGGRSPAAGTAKTSDPRLDRRITLDVDRLE